MPAVLRVLEFARLDHAYFRVGVITYPVRFPLRCSTPAAPSFGDPFNSHQNRLGWGRGLKTTKTPHSRRPFPQTARLPPGTGEAPIPTTRVLRDEKGAIRNCHNLSYRACRSRKNDEQDLPSGGLATTVSWRSTPVRVALTTSARHPCAPFTRRSCGRKSLATRFPTLRLAISPVRHQTASPRQLPSRCPAVV